MTEHDPKPDEETGAEEPTAADTDPADGAILPAEAQGALLDELESVHALLDPDGAAAAAAAEPAAQAEPTHDPAPAAPAVAPLDPAAVPTLEQPVGGASWVDRLLDEQWQDASSAVIVETRERLRDMGLADDDPDTRALVDQLANELGRLLPDKLHATVDAELQAFRIALMNRLRIEVADLVDLLINDLTDPDRDAPHG